MSCHTPSWGVISRGVQWSHGIGPEVDKHDAVKQKVYDYREACGLGLRGKPAIVSRAQAGT
jgi:hypothetical protein